MYLCYNCMQQVDKAKRHFIVGQTVQGKKYCYMHNGCKNKKVCIRMKR